MIGVTLTTVVVSVLLFIIIPKGFFPQQDTGRLMGMIQASQDISFQAMKGKLQRIVDTIMRDPAVDTVTAFTGGGGSTRNTGAETYRTTKTHC
jgi:multidrug efflux pump